MKKMLKVQTHTRITRYLLLALALGLMILALCLTGCGGKEAGEPLDSADETNTANPSTTDTEATTLSEENALRTHYEALIRELKDELLKEKEDRYISDHEYKKRLEELEKALAAFEKETQAKDQPTLSPAETESETRTPETTEPEPTVTFNYRLENNEIIITAYKGTEKNVTVPPEIDGHPVTSIDDHAFQNTGVSSVVLPNTVTSIGWFAFYGCFGLKLVSIPASVTNINYAAFDGCPNLTLICPADSYAARYAVSFGLKHEYV